jgi:sulfonate transport system ATP-binding protein
MQMLAEPMPGRDAQTNDAAPGVSVAVHRLVKSYGESRVLSGVDVFIPAGQFLAIVGRSGCGKSTLLRLIAGLDKPDSGRIIYDEGKTAAAAQLRVMFQEPRLLPWAKVVDNVGVGFGQARNDPGAELRALKALDLVALGDRADEWPSRLSGGQKQRVALARALVSRPRLLAFDEPLGALDALTRIEMQQLLEKIWLREGFTALLVTHDVSEAVALADRIIILEQGDISLDLVVDLPRPRRRGALEAAHLERQILDRLLGAGAAHTQQKIGLEREHIS